MFERIGIVGAGAMGRGIAQLFASAGKQVWLHDARNESISEALRFNCELLERGVAKGRLSIAELDATLARMQAAPALADLSGCDLVIEAIVENLEAKQALFIELEPLLAEDAVLATNTSSLSVTRIAAACQHPERVAGFHFFNPVPLMRLVEVVRGERSDPQVIERLVKLAEEAGHFPAITPDTPGFLVNHAGRAYSTEAQRILAEGIANAEQIDRILRDGPGFRMGPFELFDLTGLDISHAVMESVYQQFYQDPRYTPSYQAAQRVAARLLGRKTGQGYYRYENGQQIRTPEPQWSPVVVERPFWLDSQDAELRGRLAALLREAGTQLETGEAPSERAICLITPLGEDASTMIAKLDLPATRSIAFDLFADFDRRRVLMRQPALDPALEAQARQALSHDGVPVEVINDSPGFVSQRVVASIVNLGCEIAQKGIADPQTLDRAITLALGYPKGPMGFAEHYGAGRILAILQAMQGCYGGEARYRPSPWLRRRVQLSLPLSAPDGPLVG
ncbi:3-hydroxyacyl-CoA dehydrogenase [Stutzerimonas stutzeri]|jgi:3-hydroxybutyryl-CoA dehydrogenase|uniref:3-hydroxyacyl-CoA dehydrogenase n=1 Tax=Stutzerimonas stutzeri TaxID=316 RepID=UPI00190DFB65|nr:3-hydroxyacyl-CoA dehydrogenase [Stutzerimonas stutzeri]MBK3805577.1 3-hydroxyacyl-CoA dehydrogenase [Stutzerimonas stutzeri]MBK3853960.1 3-hydroxyacyl-CoA dehydrogenase [Stutzerimonas stutzeri]